METVPAAIGDAQWRRSLAPGMVAGVLALATAWFALEAIARVPFAGLALNLALAWGAYAAIQVGIHRHPASHHAWVAALAPWLAAPMLLRMHLLAMHETLPTWAATTWTLEAISVVFGVTTILGYRHLLADLATTRAAFLAGGSIGLALSGVFLLLHITMPDPVPSGALAVLGLTLGTVTLLVAGQHVLLRSNQRAQWRALSGGAALGVTASQMLDGIVTYLAVIDPLNLLQQPMKEQVALSAWLLDTTGIGYPIVKLALAVGIAFMLERNWPRSEPTAKRTGLYLAIILVGLGPALYSTASLLA